MTLQESLPAGTRTAQLTKNAQRFFGGLFGVSAESQGLDMEKARRLLVVIAQEAAQKADEHVRPGLLQKFALAKVHVEFDTPHETAVYLTENGTETNKSVVAGEIRVLTRMIHQQLGSAAIIALQGETTAAFDPDSSSAA